ncbi:MAG: hypothetical protein BRC48_03335 [Cyanobacteria bacterium QS_9_48_30]|nr:MAG: hypothetical protein BRC48_03335 [Cyanobacteria bacterium QS_9_48_30]
MNLYWLCLESTACYPPGTTAPYGVRRTRSHLMGFDQLYEDIKRGKIDSGSLEKVEKIEALLE